MKIYTKSILFKALVIGFILSISINSFAGIFGPSSFEDCILDGVKSAKSQAAVDAIKQACAIKFSDVRETKGEKKIRESNLLLKVRCLVSSGFHLSFKTTINLVFQA